MTEPTPTPVKTGKGMKILLAASLALNLAVVGTVAGVALRGHDTERPSPMAVRDLNFGPFTDALTRDQRRAMLRGFAEKGPDLRALRAQMRSDFDGVLTSLRATPFDPVAFEAAVAAQGQRIAERANTGRDALVTLILGMSDAERTEFAARLEKSLTRKGSKQDKRD